MELPIASFLVPHNGKPAMTITTRFMVLLTASERQELVEGEVGLINLWLRVKV